MGPEDIPLLIIVGGMVLGPPLWGIIDAARLPSEAWKRAGQSKPAFIVMQALLGVPGTIAYAMVVRPKVKEAKEQLSRR